MPVHDYYDASAWEIGGERTDLQQREVVSLDLIDELGRVGSALDIGCGDGLFMRALRDRFVAAGHDTDLWGVDYSDYKVGRAAEAGLQVKQCDLDDGLPFDDASFDLVYAAELIEHLFDPDLLLEECHRVLRPGGRLLVTTPNLQAWYNRALFPLGIKPIFYEMSTRSATAGAGPLGRFMKGEIPVGHVHLLNRAGLVDMLESEGFTVRTVTGAGFEGLPRVVWAFDRLLNRVPSLASNLVVVAEARPSVPR